MCSHLVKGTSVLARGPCTRHSLGPGAEGAPRVYEGGSDLLRVLRHGVAATDAQCHRLATTHVRLTCDDNNRFGAGESGLRHSGHDLACQALPAESGPARPGK